MAGARKPCRGYDGAARPRPGPDAHRPRAEPFRGGRHGDADLARVGHGQPGGGDAPPLQEGHGVDGLRCRGQGDAEEGRPWAIMGAAGRRHQFGRAVPPGPRCDGSRRSRPESPRRPSQGVTGAFTFPQVYGLLGRPLRPCLFNVGVQGPAKRPGLDHRVHHLRRAPLGLRVGAGVDVERHGRVGVAEVGAHRLDVDTGRHRRRGPRVAQVVEGA